MSISQSTISSHLHIDGVSIRFGDRRVLTDVSLNVSSDERIGLIGENGSGKSSLLKVAASLLVPDRGTVTYVTNSTEAIGLLHQEPPFAPSDSVSQALETAVKPARDAAIAIDQLASRLTNTPNDPAALEAYANALTDADRLDAWSIDARIAITLAGLGLSDINVDQLISNLSGGEQARLSLAWLLLRGPEVLLLDEPTNHLDDHAIEHLKQVLKDWPGPVLVTSHDRMFLDDIATAIVDLDPAPESHQYESRAIEEEHGISTGVTRFTGTYSDYLQTRAASRIRWERQYRDEQNELKHLRASVQTNQTVGHTDWQPRSESKISKKFYGDRNATVVARRVNDAKSRLETLQNQQLAKPPTELIFSGMIIDSPNKSGSDDDLADEDEVLTVNDLTLRDRLEPISFDLNRSDKILITGSNGAGKSTLLHLIAGHLFPSGGSIHYADGIKIELLAQETKMLIPYGNGNLHTVASAFVEAVGSQQAEKTPLDSFGLLHRRDENLPISALSIGQRKRLELAIILAKAPHVLLLDEPTNHLSLPLVSALEQEIPDYPGTVIVASHDRWLRQHWTGHQINLEKPNSN